MSILAVAKKDFRDAIRSRELWILMGLFVLFLPVPALYDALAGSSVEDGTTTLTLFASILVMVFIAPITALVVSVKSIVRERTLGTIRILLALPHTRGEVYLGKLLGRTAVFVVAVLVGYLPAFVILAVGVSGFSMGPFIGGFFVTLFFGFIFLVIGFCASAWMKSEASALVVGFVIFVLMYGWDSIFFAINDGLGLFRGNAETFMARFELIVIGEDIANALTSLWDSDVSSASQAVSNGSDVPFYLQHWFAFVLLAIWIVGPLALGYWKFNRAEL